MRSNNLQAVLMKKWRTADGELARYAARYAPDYSAVDISQCPSTVLDLERRHDAAERDAADALRAFLAEYEATLLLKRKDAAGAVTGDEFEKADREVLIGAIAPTFMPWVKTGVDRGDFGSAAKFETAYVGSAATKDLVDDALKAARAHASPTPTCAGLMAD